jgi:hypothetical protein
MSDRRSDGVDLTFLALVVIMSFVCGCVFTTKSTPYRLGQAVIEECGKPAKVCEYEYFNGDNDE